jgi:hypothetical protein
VSRLADSYLLTRAGFLSDRRDQALSRLRDQLADLDPAEPAASPAGLTRQRLQEATTDILLTPTTAGEVVRTRGPVALRRQAEVPVVTGAALGLAVGAILVATFPGWRPLHGRTPGRTHGRTPGRGRGRGRGRGGRHT